MSGDPVLPGYEFEGRGPGQRRLLEWLSARVPDCSFDSAVAQRSPAGPWALRIHAPNRVPSVADLLRAESWVERVAVRPQHLYVRVGGERLSEWVVEGFASPEAAAATVGGSEGRGRSVLVRAVDVDALAAAGVPRPLRLFRETAVARSVAALLRSRGFDVTLELIAPGRETYDEVWAAAPGSVTHSIVVGSGVPLPVEVERGDHVVHLPVGEVDVRHGPLRARNGGSVSADDVVAEIARGAGGGAGGAGAVVAEHAYGEAVLALLLLATPRARRIQLDDGALQREVDTFGCLLEALGVVGPAGEHAGAGADVLDTAGSDGAAVSDSAAGSVREAVEAGRDLAAEVDLVAVNAARGVTALDPALIARSLRSIAERSERCAATGSGVVESPLWAAAGSGVATLLAEAGIDMAWALAGGGGSEGATVARAYAG